MKIYNKTDFLKYISNIRAGSYPWHIHLYTEPVEYPVHVTIQKDNAGGNCFELKYPPVDAKLQICKSAFLDDYPKTNIKSIDYFGLDPNIIIVVCEVSEIGINLNSSFILIGLKTSCEKTVLTFIYYLNEE